MTRRCRDFQSERPLSISSLKDVNEEPAFRSDPPSTLAGSSAKLGHLSKYRVDRVLDCWPYRDPPKDPVGCYANADAIPR
jgi:hypothetical protein